MNPIARCLCVLLVFSMLAGSAEMPSDRQNAKDILKELIEIDTADSSGDVTRAAEAMAARFRAAGYPDSDIHVLAPVPRKGNLIVRLRGSSPTLKPILFLCHLDVVEARREDWSVDPFQFIEKDGYFYGRGTQDMKSDDALMVATFTRLKREHFVPIRDMILALTAGEESGIDNGPQWLLKEHRDLIDADYAIVPDAGGGQIKNGKKLFMGVQAAEKNYATFRIDARNAGGHSSLPKKDNAIYELADALVRLRQLEFPARLNPVTETFFKRLSEIEPGPVSGDFRAVTQTPPDPAAVERLSRDTYYNAVLRTTCIPTMLKGGHAENALPQLAEVTVNCRLVPGDTAAAVQNELTKTVADPKLEVAPGLVTPESPVSPLRVDVLNAITVAVERTWGRIPVVPLMETGATDGKWLRIAGIPAYGVSALFLDVDDIRAHGRDERVSERSFYDGVRFDYELVRRLGSGSPGPVR